MHYAWPGNVRELENTVERAIILSRGRPLTFDDLPSSGANASQQPLPPASEDVPLNLDQAMARHIRNVLEMTGGKVEGKNGAAKLLGINPNTLRNRMTKLGIQFGRNVKKKYKG
jgi:DNA-binding NtrC family response regulator